MIRVNSNRLTAIAEFAADLPAAHLAAMDQPRPFLAWLTARPNS
ncbi:hypothetical protein [Streptomyces mirabilis]